MSKIIAIDSNIFLYALDTTLTIKGETALHLILENDAIFSTQVLSEVVNVCHKRWKFSKEQLMTVVEFLLRNCSLVGFGDTAVLKAHSLIKRYDFQYFDALIVSAALSANCTILYIEDMHHGLVVEGVLSIINPFK
jgi:predicted nucleic acid-binding protein